MWVLYALWHTGTFVRMCMYVCVHMCVCLHVCSKYWDHFMVRFINCTFHLTYDLHFFKSINTSLHHQFKLLQIILFLKSMINWWTISHEFFFFIKSTAMIMFINKCVYFLTFTPWYLFTYVFCDLCWQIPGSEVACENPEKHVWLQENYQCWAISDKLLGFQSPGLWRWYQWHRKLTLKAGVGPKFSRKTILEEEVPRQFFFACIWFFSFL